MSKLAKALEKAEQAREATRKEERPNREVSVGEARATIPSVAVRPSYSTTRVVPLADRHLEEHRIMTHINDSKVIDQYNLLRTQILQRTRDRGWNTLMVTSPGPGEGKTVTAINLAMTMAKEANQTALLVDTNLRNPRVSRYLGLEENTAGLSDYLLDENLEVPDLLINPGLDKLVVLPGGRPLTGSTDLLGTPRMQGLVRELKSRYPDRYVVYDCPHILNMPDAMVFASYVDAILLVVKAGATPQDQIQSAVEVLSDRNIVGLVLNQA